MKTKIHIILLLLPLMASCHFREDEFIDFQNYNSAQGLSFKVIGQRETVLDNAFPDDCYLPDGTPVNAYAAAEHAESSDTTLSPRYTNSTTGANLLQQLLKYGNQNRVTEIVGTYPSFDSEWNPITLSGKVMLPTGRRPKRLILVSHYTVCSNAEAPSNSFSLEGVLVKLGYGLIIPDYMGYGITADQVHPYLVMDQTARNVLDMYIYVREWLKTVNMTPENDDIYLMGYSQGGATTMAIEHLIETEYNDPSYEDGYIKIHRVFAGGGPYDVKATYERFVNTDTARYPVAVPLVLQGMILGNNLNMQLNDMMKDWLCDKMDNWVNSKKYTAAQINALIGTYHTHDVLKPEGMDQTSRKVAELYKAMTINSITSYYWSPEASVYIMHSMDDEVVPYTNASNAKARWKDANIQYNFGHYGSHIKCALRFIYTVQSLIIEEEQEVKKYE
ncbi:MAG: hypothetical protein IJS13_10350 [Paludibacteraceae bacterium]|nr:hypothetical protein [Paludibacteraceae bacterium]